MELTDCRQLGDMKHLCSILSKLESSREGGLPYGLIIASNLGPLLSPASSSSRLRPRGRYRQTETRSAPHCLPAEVIGRSQLESGVLVSLNFP